MQCNPAVRKHTHIADKTSLASCHPTSGCLKSVSLYANYSQDGRINLGGLQVLTAVQRVLGAVRMQQQRDATRTVGVQHPESPDFGRASSAWRVVEAERGERAAQQAVKPLQKKGTVWEAELGAAQTSNAQLHQQVGWKLSVVTDLVFTCDTVQLVPNHICYPCTLFDSSKQA